MSCFYGSREICGVASYCCWDQFTAGFTRKRSYLYYPSTEERGDPSYTHSRKHRHTSTHTHMVFTFAPLVIHVIFLAFSILLSCVHGESVVFVFSSADQSCYATQLNAFQTHAFMSSRLKSPRCTSYLLCTLFAFCSRLSLLF